MASPHRYFQNQSLGQATALGAAETGAPGIWASLTTGTGRSGFGLAPLATGNQGFGPTSASGTTASGGRGQWANPTTSTEISGFGLAQPATWRGTTGHGDGLRLRPTGIFQNQGLGQATALGAAKTGAPGIWASLTTGTGMSGFGLAPLATGNQGFGPTSALGGTASGGLGQWANPTTGMGISGFGLAQPATGNQGYGQATA